MSAGSTSKLLHFPTETYSYTDVAKQGIPQPPCTMERAVNVPR